MCANSETREIIGRYTNKRSEWGTAEGFEKSIYRTAVQVEEIGTGVGKSTEWVYLVFIHSCTR